MLASVALSQQIYVMCLLKVSQRHACTSLASTEVLGWEGVSIVPVKGCACTWSEEAATLFHLERESI
jgi:hypothetical protein